MRIRRWLLLTLALLVGLLVAAAIVSGTVAITGNSTAIGGSQTAIRASQSAIHDADKAIHAIETLSAQRHKTNQQNLASIRGEATIRAHENRQQTMAVEHLTERLNAETRAELAAVAKLTRDGLAGQRAALAAQNDTLASTCREVNAVESAIRLTIEQVVPPGAHLTPEQAHGLAVIVARFQPLTCPAS